MPAGRAPAEVAGEMSFLPILFEDRYLIAVHKPGGLLSIASAGERTRTVHRILNDRLQRASHGRERAFIVHRLDREVSGIMLLARSPEIQERLQTGWPRAEKLYSALVQGRPPRPEGTIRSWLRESPVHKVYSCPEGPEARLAVTHYRQVAAYPRHALLEVRLETGRKHQIRVHLADLGCPIVGDRRYGARPSPIGRFGLCAHVLAFDHPVTGRRVRLEIPVPRSMREFRGKG